MRVFEFSGTRTENRKLPSFAKVSMIVSVPDIGPAAAGSTLTRYLPLESANVPLEAGNASCATIRSLRTSVATCSVVSGPLAKRTVTLRWVVCWKSSSFGVQVIMPAASMPGGAPPTVGLTTSNAVTRLRRSFATTTTLPA